MRMSLSGQVKTQHLNLSLFICKSLYKCKWPMLKLSRRQKTLQEHPVEPRETSQTERKNTVGKTNCLPTIEMRASYRIHSSREFGTSSQYPTLVFTHCPYPLYLRSSFDSMTFSTLSDDVRKQRIIMT